MPHGIASYDCFGWIICAWVCIAAASTTTPRNTYAYTIRGINITYTVYAFGSIGLTSRFVFMHSCSTKPLLLEKTVNNTDGYPPKKKL